MEKYTFIALSHYEALDGLAVNGAGKAILISIMEVEVLVEGWVDMEFKGLTGFTEGVGVRVTIVAGLIDVGMWGKGLLVGWGVTTASRGLLGFESGLIVSGSWLS